MLTVDFRLDDIILDLYLYSLVLSILIVVLTYFMSKRYVIATKPVNVKMNDENVEDTSDKLNSEETLPTATVDLKKSQALVAEKVIEASLTEEQRLLEHQVRQEQLTQIYELMIQQSDKFGNISMEEVEEQMKLYQ